MSARVVDLAYVNACRELKANIVEIKIKTDHAIKLLEAATNARRKRINRQLEIIENEVSWRLPSDCEVPFDGRSSK